MVDNERRCAVGYVWHLKWTAAKERVGVGGRVGVGLPRGFTAERTR